MPGPDTKALGGFFRLVTNIEDFVLANILGKKVAELLLDDLSDKEKKAVKAFQKALKRRREGKSGDGWRGDEDK